MPSSTWTPDALASNAISLRARCWRVVEAQSQISTMKLTDTLAEQAALENLIEQSKAKVPVECEHLSYLLLTPFRYIPYPFDSRFRRAGAADGVFYASESPETAIAEAAFYRLLFYAESPDTPWPANAGEYTAFAAEIATDKALDLTVPPLVQDRAIWTHPTDYTATLDLAEAARAAAIDVIRYQSVRDPRSRANLAVLACRAFAANDAVDRQTWHLFFSRAGVRAACESPAGSIPFGPDAFAADPRINSLRWER
jgi:hypothetical protein